MCSRCVLLVRFVDVWDALMDRNGAVQLYHQYQYQYQYQYQFRSRVTHDAK